MPSPDEYFRWISVKDRFPDEGQYILVVGVPNGAERPLTLDTHYHKDVGLISNITYWLPLPEIPDDA